MKHNSQAGSLLTLVMIGLLAAGILATIAFSSYYQITRGTHDTALRAHAATLLTQAAYILATEGSDSDVDGVNEPPAGTTAYHTAWKIPASSGAPKTDAWGTDHLYCPWDNGSVNTSPGRFNGVNPAVPSSIQFALISAGPNKAFDTSCEQAKTSAQADDGVRSMTVAQMNGYFWDGTRWKPLYIVPELTAVAWAAPCGSYPAGTLARDASDNLFICRKAGTWQQITIP